MYFCHAPEIWKNFPQLVPGLMVVDGIHQNVDVEKYLQPRFEQARERLSREKESQMPEIAAWRRAYSQMGFKPSKYRSAAEALLRRFKRENYMPRLHPLVDICNATSLAFALPVAVIDLERVEEYLEVCYAKGTEQYLSFSGEIETPSPGEVIFVDAANQVHARRWTFRQSRTSTIRPETTQVLIISEGLHETADQDVGAVIDSLSEIISSLWSPPKCQTTLTKESPQVHFL
ncbi:MAG: phenylalanine--tRNA ligase beta subunit-related protein [Chloroflexota bacterium]